MNINEVENMIFAFALRNNFIDKLNSNYFENTEIKNYIIDFQRTNSLTIRDYIGKNNYSIARLNELVDNFDITTNEQYINLLLKLEKRHKKREILKAVKNDEIENIPNIINQSIVENSDNFKDVVRNWISSKVKEHCLTGIKKFDSFNGGLVEPEFVTIAARPGRGKTALAINLINNFLKNNKSVFFASLEMNNIQILQRLISNFCKIENWKVRKKIFSKNEEQAVYEYISYMQSKKLRIDDNINLTLEQLKMKCFGYDIVVVDYIQLLDTEKKFKNDFEKLEYVAKEIKKIAKNNKQIIICLAQLNRESEKTKQLLGSIKGSGAIEQSSDIVIFLNKKEDNNIVSIDVAEQDEIIYFDVMKYREGRIGKIMLHWKKSTYTFENVDI